MQLAIAKDNQQDAPFFSIVTVVMNDVKGFVATRESMARLATTEMEWVVVDGSSSDGLVEYLKAGDALIANWVSEADSGIYDAMNKGVALARGKYVVFMNAGDTFEDSDTLGYVRQAVEREDLAPDVVFGGAHVVFENGIGFYRAPRQADESVWHGLPANHQATYYKRKLLLAHPYDLSYKICGDYYLVASLIKAGVRAAYVDKSLVRFRAGGTSHKYKRKLIIEPYRIQRDVLGKPGWLRVISFVRRVVATAAMVFLNAMPDRKSRMRQQLVEPNPSDSNSAEARRLSIGYFTVDSSDAKAHIRCRALSEAGANVVHFTCAIPGSPISTGHEPYSAVLVGRARKGKLLGRFFLIFRIIWLGFRKPELFRGIDVFLCRNMDMAAAGYVLGTVFNGIRAYEIVDIHPLCTRDGLVGAIARRLDRIILKNSSFLVTSSKRFMSAYFSRLGFSGEGVLLENKVHGLPNEEKYWSGRRGALSPVRKGEPVVIGYFGKLRCARSVEILANAAARLEGRLRVVFAGFAEDEVQPAFSGAVSNNEFVEDMGRYENPDDLERLYRSVHFSWCMDLSDEKNGAWLLPNRLYESGLFGVPVLAAKDTETGRVVEEMNIGVCLEEPLEAALIELVSSMSEERYERLMRNVMSIPADNFLDGDQHREIVNRMAQERRQCRVGRMV